MLGVPCDERNPSWMWTLPPKNLLESSGETRMPLSWCRALPHHREVPLWQCAAEQLAQDLCSCCRNTT